MNYVLTVSIGPVQDFIASARRSRDLWFGSWLLSELSKAAAERIVRRHKNEALIFPAPEDPSQLAPGSTFNVVNRVVALVEDPDVTAAEVERAVRERLGRLAGDAFDEIERPSRHFLRDVAEAQVADLVEIFWAAYPCDDPSDTTQYRRARARAESLLSARKMTRDFKKVTWGRPVPKSSLDGQRESVIHEDAYKHLSPRELRRAYGIRPGERLCGVGVLKRHGNRGGDDSFFSTSHVAALPLLGRLAKKEGAAGAVNTYAAKLREALGVDDRELGLVPASPPYTPNPSFSRRVGQTLYGYDGHLLFEERLADLLGERGDARKAKADTAAARSALGDFLRIAADGLRPLPYYGLLLADGDRMGAAIDAAGTPGEHRRLSQKLTAFARTALTLVAEHSGSLVYAGGDDVLAFVPLHTALRCARSLADEFAAQLGSVAGAARPTLSAGMVVAHHLDPLSDVLALARAAERRAKMVPGKNALAVTVSKRSGPDVTVSGRWGEVDERLSMFAALHIADAVPDGAAYELRGLKLSLGVEGRAGGGALDRAAHHEAVRILRRKRAARGSEELAEGVLAALEGMLARGDVSVSSLSDELRVARVFADATAQSGEDGGGDGHWWRPAAAEDQA